MMPAAGSARARLLLAAAAPAHRQLTACTV
eukprot:COSAG06_NODE_60802_length_269_cov_1.688235_1_plen_29_part_10